MATPTRRLLRRRGDGKYDALYVLDNGGAKPSLQEGVYDEEQARTAKQQGWETVDDNSFLAARRLYGPGVEVPAGRPTQVRDMVGDAATHATSSPPRRDKAMDEALRFAAGLGRDFTGAPPPPPRAPEARPAAAPPRVGFSANVSSDESSRTLRRAQAGGAKPSPEALGSVYTPEVAEYVAKYTGGPDLGPAQRSADERLLGARIARAGAMANTALTGSRLDDGYYDDLEKGAHQPVDDFLEQLRSDQTHAAGERATEEQRLRGQQAERANAADLRDFSFRESEAARQERLARDKMAQDERQHGDDMAERRRARFAVSTRAGAAAAKNGGVDPKQLAELAKRSQNASKMRKDLETINRYSASQDIPGVGPLDSLSPELFLSSEGTELRQAAIRLYTVVQHELFGTAVSPHEAALGLEGYGMGRGMSEDAFRKGMAALRDDAEEALGNIEAGYAPEVVARRRELGGTTSREIPKSAPLPTGVVGRDPRTGRLFREMSDGSAQEM